VRDSDGTRHVVIYERRAPGAFWIVDATVAADGGIHICSGDGRAEWYAIVDREAKAALHAVLRKRLNAHESESDRDDEILALLVRAFSRRFGRIHAPFREITAFLDENGIPWRSDFWGDV
jgi:hypothetical protein